MVATKTKSDTFPCGIGSCKFTSTSKGGIGIHRSRKHGVTTGSSKSRKAAVVPATGLTGSALVHVPMERQSLVGVDGIGVAAMLEVVFPEGIPTHKIGASVAWVRATDELLK